MKVGFVGLGVMGQPMCQHILRSGYQVTAFDNNFHKVEQAQTAGAKRGLNAKDVGLQSDVVITMLQNSPHVEKAIFGENGLAEGLAPGSTIIDMSSINPIESQKFAQKLMSLGIDFMDAPVSGGESGAIAGTISVMVGGSEESFAKFQPLLLTMAGSVVHCGQVGAGNYTKLANQIIVAINIAAVSEAFTLVKKAGVDPRIAFEAIKGGLASSAVMNSKVPMMLDHNYEPGFRVELHLKDLLNTLDTAHSINCSVPITASLMEMLQSLVVHGYEKSDHSAIVTYYERLNNTPL